MSIEIIIEIMWIQSCTPAECYVSAHNILLCRSRDASSYDGYKHFALLEHKGLRVVWDVRFSNRLCPLISYIEPPV